MQSRFNFESQVAQLPDLVRTNKASGLGLSLEVDTRDNIFTPSRGYTGSIDATFYDPDWGSDTSFQSYRAHAFGYWPIGKEWVIGGRIDGRTVDGRVPFFMLPYVDLRGVPAARLQDRHTAVLETELRWNMTPRWALIGFVGGGKAWGTTHQLFRRQRHRGTGRGLSLPDRQAARPVRSASTWPRARSDQRRLPAGGQAWR